MKLERGIIIINEKKEKYKKREGSHTRDQVWVNLMMIKVKDMPHHDLLCWNEPSSSCINSSFYQIIRQEAILVVGQTLKSASFYPFFNFLYQKQECPTEE